MCLNCATCGDHCPLCRPCSDWANIKVLPSNDWFTRENERLSREIERLKRSIGRLQGHICQPCYREHCDGHHKPWRPPNPPWKPFRPYYQPHWIGLTDGGT